MGLLKADMTLGADADAILLRTQQLPALVGLRLATRLGKIVAPAFAKVEGAITDESDNLSALAPAFAEFFTQLDEKQIESLALTIFASTQAQVQNAKGEEKVVALTTPNNINAVFEGRVDDLVRGLWFVLEHNFGGFISAALQKLKARAAAAKAEQIARELERAAQKVADDE